MSGTSVFLMISVVVTIIVIVLALNLYASYRCIKSDYSDYPQKYYQLAVVWLVPIIGATTIIYFSREPDTGPNYKKPDESDSLTGTGLRSDSGYSGD